MPKLTLCSVFLHWQTIAPKYTLIPIILQSSILQLYYKILYTGHKMNSSRRVDFVSCSRHICLWKTKYTSHLALFILRNNRRGGYKFQHLCSCTLHAAICEFLLLAICIVFANFTRAAAQCPLQLHMLSLLDMKSSPNGKMWEAYLALSSLSSISSISSLSSLS